MTPVVVPDASVILKWVLPIADERDTEHAIELRDKIVRDEVQALLPSLWLYEVGNTVTRRFPQQAEVWLSTLLEFDFNEIKAPSHWLPTALELVVRFQVAFYDAAYHAVALTHHGEFVTADARYFNRAKAAGNISLLKDWRVRVGNRTIN